jgi:hypothetical protein
VDNCPPINRKNYMVEDMTEEFIRIVFDPASSEEQINQYYLKIFTTK